MTKCRASIQALSLKKLPYQLLQELCPLLFPLSLCFAPSRRRCPVELAWRTFVRDTSSPSFSTFGARFPTIPPGEPTRVQGHKRDKMTQSPPAPSPIQNHLDLPPSLTCQRSRLSNCAALSTTAFLLRHVFAWEQQCLLSSTSLPLSLLLLASCPALFPSLLSLLWLVGFSRSLSCYFHTVVLRL